MLSRRNLADDGFGSLFLPPIAMTAEELTIPQLIPHGMVIFGESPSWNNMVNFCQITTELPTIGAA